MLYFFTPFFEMALSTWQKQKTAEKKGTILYLESWSIIFVGHRYDELNITKTVHFSTSFIAFFDFLKVRFNGLISTNFLPQHIKR